MVAGTQIHSNNCSKRSLREKTKLYSTWHSSQQMWANLIPSRPGEQITVGPPNHFQAQTVIKPFITWKSFSRLLWAVVPVKSVFLSTIVALSSSGCIPYLLGSIQSFPMCVGCHTITLSLHCHKVPLFCLYSNWFLQLAFLTYRKSADYSHLLFLKDFSVC